ncbi:hypothetical protein AMS68_002808 [Peltaster fructicola]|uniref:Uncharacterized protein n=1 Tax=Peltaster fructicola TaxID=286661 RepID=A0A6H0XRK8_9PEZI|nr:hypothetical protein AMS68_002808 [Peltaster fructicola]
MTGSDMPSGYSRDPRLYFTVRVPTLEREWMLQPPNGGWPDITPELFKPLGKTIEVVELLAHMPYICIPGRDKPWAPHQTWPVITRNTRLIDFHDERVSKALRKATQEEKHLRSRYLEYIQQPLLDLPPWVVCLTTGMVHGDYLLLDTSDGTVTRYMVVDSSHDPDYAQGDPRSWRNECSKRTMPVREYFLMIRIDIDALLWIPWIHDKAPDVMFPGDSPGEAAYLKALYTKHGWLWPDTFDREACRRALIDWDEAGSDYRKCQIQMLTAE